MAGKSWRPISSSCPPRCIDSSSCWSSWRTSDAASCTWRLRLIPIAAPSFARQGRAKAATNHAPSHRPRRRHSTSRRATPPLRPSGGVVTLPCHYQAVGIGTVGARLTVYEPSIPVPIRTRQHRRDTSFESTTRHNTTRDRSSVSANRVFSRDSRFSSIRYATASRSRPSGQPVSTHSTICNVTGSITSRSYITAGLTDVGRVVEHYERERVLARLPAPTSSRRAAGLAAP